MKRGEPGGLQSTGSPRVGHDLAAKQQHNPMFADALSIFGRCGSEWGAILSPVLVVFRDIFGCHNWGGAVWGSW